ncbi:MAG TPA: hypothetical protein VKB76_08965, partial [Ktedonobacterales bacterium]|nr:hypothetical protein [Ktedonobacterales bacterium]
RLNELSAHDRQRLRNEIVASLLAEMTYPPIMDYRAGMMRVRPANAADRQRASEFVAMARILEENGAVDISSSALVTTISELILQYQAAIVPPYVEVQRRLAPQRQAAPRLAAEIQRRLMAYVLDGAQNDFGDVATERSWKESGNAMPLLPPWETIAPGTAALANALARLREERPVELPRPATASVADTDTERLPSIAVAALPDLPPVPKHLPTAPLPRPVEMPPPADYERNDHAIFTQMRQQMLAAMAAAGVNYGIAAPIDDPAGLLAALRAHDVIDDSDLRLAEGILALCGRVIATGRASIDDFRQAMTLYLLFQRKRLGV